MTFDVAEHISRLTFDMSGMYDLGLGQLLENA